MTGEKWGIFLKGILTVRRIARLWYVSFQNKAIVYIKLQMWMFHSAFYILHFRILYFILSYFIFQFYMLYLYTCYCIHTLVHRWYVFRNGRNFQPEGISTFIFSLLNYPFLSFSPIFQDSSFSISFFFSYLIFFQEGKKLDYIFKRKCKTARYFRGSPSR